MTTEHSTYTYEGGAQETVTLTRGRATPPGHAVLRIKYSEGRVVDCYVNTAWLRDRLDDLGEPCPLTPDAITDEMVKRAWHRALDFPTLSSATRSAIFAVLVAALTEPPARDPRAVALDADMRAWDSEDDFPDQWLDGLADHLARLGWTKELS